MIIYGIWCEIRYINGKGRDRTRLATAKLTYRQVAEIRQSKKGPRATAREYGVTHPTIINIRNGKTWSAT